MDPIPVSIDYRVHPPGVVVETCVQVDGRTVDAGIPVSDTISVIPVPLIGRTRPLRAALQNRDPLDSRTNTVHVIVGGSPVVGPRPRLNLAPIECERCPSDARRNEAVSPGSLRGVGIMPLGKRWQTEAEVRALNRSHPAVASHCKSRARLCRVRVWRDHLAI